MTHDEVLAMLRKILAEHLGVDPDSVTMEATYQEDLGADSLDLVELVMELEDQFNLKISDEEAQAMITVGDTVSYIVEHTT